MKKQIFRRVWNLLFILTLIGCQSVKNEEDLSFADLSKLAVESLQFDHTESTQEIESGLPEEGWYLLSDADWMKANKQGAKIIVTVTPNTGVTERTANLNVISGSRKKNITILQAPQTLNKDLVIPDVSELVTEQWAAKEDIYISAPNSNWSAASTVEWMTVESIPEHGKIEISLLPNEEVIDRTGEIRIIDNQSNEILQSIQVRQKAAMYFILPYQEVGAEIGDIREFETARMSVLTGKPDGFNNQDRYTFTTKSRIFKNLIYYVAGNYFYQVDVELDSDELQQEGILNKILAFLQENGYEMQEDGKTLINEEKALKAYFGQDEATQGVILHISNNPVQPQAYKTFDAFPPQPLFWDYNQADEIAKYEEGIGSKVWVEQQEIVEADAKAKNTEVLTYWYLRSMPDSHAVYFLNADGETSGAQIVTTYNDFTLGFYEFKGQYFLTNEFRTLLEKSGFSISEYDYIFKKYDLIGQGVQYMAYVSDSRVTDGGPKVLWLSAVQP